MELSAKLVINHLKQHFKMKTSDNLSADQVLKYPVLYNRSLPLKEGLIFVIDDPSFSLSHSDPGKTLLILIGKKVQLDVKKYSNICVISSDVSTALVFQVLQEVFEIYNDWCQNIFQMMTSAPTVQRLLDVSSFAITNPMMVIGMDFTVLGSIRAKNLQNLRNSIFGSDELTKPIVDSLKSDANYHEAAGRSGFFFYPGNDTASPCLCVNIKTHGVTTHRLLVYEGPMPLDDTIGFVAEYLAMSITKVIESTVLSDFDDTPSLHHTFSSLMTNSKADYVTISQRLTASGWIVSHMYQCILVKPSTLDTQNMTLKAIRNYIENIVPDSVALEHHGNIAVFLNLSLTSSSGSARIQKLTTFIRDSLLTAGFSRVMMGHFNFYRQYQQARIALNLGSKKNPTSWTHHFEDIALTYMMRQMTQSLPAYMIAHEKLLQLKYQDEEGNSDLFNTLRCYLENNQNATKTAQLLYIHRSTLLYRLERIMKYMKNDLSNPDEIFYLLLSYRLLEEEEASDK